MTKKLLGTISIALTVASANAQLFKPSPADQVKAGKEYAAKIRKENKVLPDSDPRVKLLREVGQRFLDARTPEEKKKEIWQYSFDVIDSKEVNAFAIPGGPVFFFTGLLDKLTNVDEIAGIMGHELTHVRRQHWASAVNSQQEKQAGLILLGTLFGVKRQQMDILQVVNEFGFNLAASRGQEREADQYGFDFDLRAGYNPEGMIQVFQMFEHLKGSGSTPEFLSTHPDDKSRISSLQKKLADYQKSGKIRSLPALTPLPFETTAMKEAKNPKTKDGGGGGKSSGGTR
ncbi:MAG: M48 family metalloprotease [Armatimonadetes bacterium]|nr:M48 family metalloprotease [Armatimonadota bacterium]MBS1725497.1 M48 family metalloprotease [Armatimonadota bacterium]